MVDRADQCAIDTIVSCPRLRQDAPLAAAVLFGPERVFLEGSTDVIVTGVAKKIVESAVSARIATTVTAT